jgi:HSP20 family protein
MITLTRTPATEGTLWSPLDRLSSLRQEMDRLWELTFPARTTSFFSGWSPALDLYDAEDRLIAKVELPGMKKEDIEIAYQDGVLNLSGERKPDAPTAKDTQPYRTERFTGKFQRSLTLPVPIQVDQIRASYKDGVLTIELPKSEEAKPHKVEVSVS